MPLLDQPSPPADPHTSSPPDGRAPSSAVALLAAVAAVMLAMALAHGSRIVDNLSEPHWEDELFIVHDRTEVVSLSRCLTAEPLWPGLYRPLTTNCYYRLGGVIFGHRLAGYHLVNAVFHLANGVLLYLLGRRLLGRWWAIAPAVLFVSRAAHAEVVTNTAEFQALFYVFWSLLALLVWSHHATGTLRTRWPALAAVVLALLSKEAAIATLPMMAILHSALTRRLDRRAAAVPAALAALWLGLLVTVVPTLTDGQRTGFGYELRPAAVVTNLAAYLLSWLNPLVWGEDVVLPSGVFELAGSPVGVFSVAAVLAVPLVGLVQAVRNGPDSLGWPLVAAAFGCAFFVAASAPFVVLDDRLFLRYGYYGHVGLSLAAGAGLAALAQTVVAARRRRSGR